MDDLFWLSRPQMKRIAPYFPLSHGITRVLDEGAPSSESLNVCRAQHLAIGRAPALGISSKNKVHCRQTEPYTGERDRQLVAPGATVGIEV